MDPSGIGRDVGGKCLVGLYRSFVQDRGSLFENSLEVMFRSADKTCTDRKKNDKEFYLFSHRSMTNQ